jgi:hypothetical protein
MVASARVTERIADTRHVPHPGAVPAGGKLAAQPADVRVDRPCRATGLIAPYLIDELRPGENALGLLGQVDKERELEFRQG